MEIRSFESWEKIAYILERVISTIEFQEIPCNSSRTIFDSVKVPQISIYDYFSRIHRYTNCSESCYTLAFIYIDRVLQNNPLLILTRKNIHRLILPAIILAIKFTDDLYSDNSFYAMVGGVNLFELNHLESTMLQLLSFELFVNPELYYQYFFSVDMEYQKFAESQRSQLMKDNQEREFKSIIPTESMGTMITIE